MLRSREIQEALPITAIPLAAPSREAVVRVGGGTYPMLNSEIATSGI